VLKVNLLTQLSISYVDM